MSMRVRFAFATFLAAAFAAGASDAVSAAKSAYVALLKPNEVFAPVDATIGVGVEPIVDTDEVFPAVYVEDFKVDGNMEKDVWGKGRPIPALIDYRSKKEMSYKSDIRILYSKTAIYIGATLWQDMSQMTAKWDQQDMPIWNDDNLEVFVFAPSNNGNRLYQFILNPINSLADLRDGIKNYWVRGKKHATKRFGDRWTMEMKLPFAGIPIDRPVAGDFVGIRFCRTVHSPNIKVGSLPMLLSAGHSQRARFAKLLFEKPEGIDAERLVAEGEAYRKDALRKRFYERFAEDKVRFKEVRGCAATFAQSKHPIHEKAWAGIRQMEAALDAFEKRFADDLAAERIIPQKDADAILSQFSGFHAFASKHAYVVWQTDPWERGTPHDLPPENAMYMPSAINFEQAGNEREAVCLNIMGVLCGPRLDLRIHPQSVERAKNQAFLSTDRFEVYSEPFIRFGSEVITAPHVRTPGNIVTVSPGRTERVWVMLNSRGVEPGEYKTHIAFKSANDLAVTDRNLPVSVKLWNFTLPETRDWPISGFFWGPGSFAEDEVALLELTHDYHVTHGWTQYYRYQYGLYDDKGWYSRPNKGKSKVDKAHDFEDQFALNGNEKFLRRAKELGMKFVIGWGTPISVAWFDVFSSRLLNMGFNYDDFVFHSLLRDEFSKADIPKQASQREAVWNWNTNLNFLATYISTPPPTGATMDDIEAAKLSEFFKVWAVTYGRCRDPKKGPDTISRLRGKGCKVWTYRCAQFMVRQPILDYYRFYPWDAYMHNLDGFAFWTVFRPNGDDGWDSRDGYDEGLCWRGLDKKPVPTKMLEAVREGLEDVAYMDALEKALTRVGAAAEGCRPPVALLAKAKSLLAEREAIIKAKNQRRVDAWRLAVGRIIDDIIKRLGKGE